MSDALIDHSQGGRNPSTVRNTWSLATLAFGAKDKFQQASLKAVNKREAGWPKAKHMSILKDFIHKDFQKFEEFVVTCHALSPWAEKVTTCCKAMISILVLMQTGPPVSDATFEAINHFLTSIRDTWAMKDMFLSQFAVVLIQRLGFLQEHAEFKSHFSLVSTTSNGQSLPRLDSHSSVSVLSQLLSYQSMLLNLINLGLKNQRNVGYMRAKERETIKCSLFALYEDSFCTYVACLGILQFVNQRGNKGTLAAAASTLEIMTDLYCEQFNQLSTIFFALQDIGNTNSTGSGGNSYGTLEHEISRLPDNNPLQVNSTSSDGSGQKFASGPPSAMSISH